MSRISIDMIYNEKNQVVFADTPKMVRQWILRYWRDLEDCWVLLEKTNNEVSLDRYLEMEDVAEDDRMEALLDRAHAAPAESDERAPQRLHP